MTTTTRAIKMKLAGSDEIFAAPEGYDVKRAVKWLADLRAKGSGIHATEYAPGRWRATNGRRGANERTSLITIEADA